MFDDMSGGEWRYRLVVLPLRHPQRFDDEPDEALQDKLSDWELVSTKVSEDKITEQRLYRRPA